MAALLLEGRLPYVGSWDQNFPGVLLIHTPQVLLLGRSQVAFHIWDIGLQLIGAYILFKVALQLGGRSAALLAPILCVCYYVQQGFWMAGERDTYVSILLIIALYETIRDDRIQRRFGLIGLLVGTALLFRPTYGLAAVCFLAFIAVREKGYPVPFRSVLYLLLPWIAICVIYALAGGLGEFYNAVITFNTSIYIGQGEVFPFWEPVRFYAPLILFSLIGVVVIARKRVDTALLLVALFLACLVSLLLLYRYSVYHYHPAMTIFLLLASIGLGKSIDAVSRVGNGRSSAIIRASCVAVVILFMAFQTLRGNTIKTVLSDLATGKITNLWQAYHYYEPSLEFGVLRQREVGDYLKSRIAEGEPVQMFGPYSYPQYFAHASTASRFQTLHALTMRQGSEPLMGFQIEWRKEYLIDLLRVQPRYFIVCDAPEAFRQYYGGRLGHEILREDMTDVGMWLSSNYRPDTVIGAFTIYRKNAQ